MKRSRNILMALGALLCSLGAASAQGTFQRITVTFDGPPVQPPGTQNSASYYEESGVWFRPIPGKHDNSFTRNGGGISF